MVKSRFVSVGRVLFLGLVLVSCRGRDSGEPTTTEATEQKQSALVVNLFSASVTRATGSNATAVGVADLDGDGKSDIAVLTDFQSDPANDYMVNVFIQDTDGTLKPRVQYPVSGPSTRSLDIGDVNGDGRADVVVTSANGANGSVQVLLQNGTGTLDAPIIYPTPNAGQLTIGDFNGDGRMDVASLVAAVNGDGLDIFLQTPAGTLASPVTYHVPHLDGLAAGDLNGDGKTDLAVLGPSAPTRTLSVLLQNADGTIAAPVSYSAATSDSLIGLAVGDTNGDGRADMVVGHNGSAPAIARLLQDAQGALAAPIAYPSAGPGPIVVADMDADGRKDVLVLHGGSVGVGLYRQTASGDFKLWTSEFAPATREQVYGIPFQLGFGPQALAVGDVNGDGLRDVAVADGTSGLVILPHTTDLEPTVAFTSPAPGTYIVGQPIPINWTASSDAVSFFVSASFDGGTSYTTIPGCFLPGPPVKPTTCTWAQPGPAAAGVRLRLLALDMSSNEGYAETTINLETPRVTVTAPANFATVYAGNSATITWSSNLPPTTTMRIEVTRDNGSTYTTLETAAPNTGNYLWAVTGPSMFAQVRVSANGPVTASGTSGGFAIASLAVTGPTAGSSILMGSTLSVTWSGQYLVPTTTVKVELSLNGGATYLTLASSVNASLGSYQTTAPFATTNAVVRVTVNGSVPPASSTSGAFTIVFPSLTVTSPVAGTNAFVGTTLPITWTSNVLPGTTIKIELTRDNGATYTTLMPSVPNTGSYTWIASGPDTTGARVRLTSIGASATSASSGTFAITTGTVTVSAPTAGAMLLSGTPATVSWSTNQPGVATALIELSRDGGASFETLAAAAPNTGSFSWNVSGPDATALVRVTLNAPGLASGTSGAFAIVTPSLGVTSPVAGTTAFAGTALPITWTTNLPPATTIMIELSLDNGGTYTTLTPSAPNTGSFLWPVSGPDTAAARVRLTANGFPVASGTSGAFAIVTPAVAVTAPAAGSTFFAGTPATVAWSTNVPGIATALIELSRDGGASFETLAPAAPNTGTFAWTVTGPDATALVRVTLNGPVLASGTSGAFGIVVPSIAVTAPAEGAALTVGTAQTITWTDNLPADAALLIELTRDGGASFETLAAATANTGSFAWTVTGPAAAEARVRITSTVTPAAGASGAFAIVAPTPALTLTAPTAGASLVVGLPATIAWTHNLPAGPTVRIELSRDGGTTFTTLASGAPNTGSFAWTVAGAITSTAMVRVTWNGTPSVVSTSGAFSIVKAAITVSGPAAGAAWPLGSAQTISWSSNLPPTGTVRVELSRDSGTTYTTLTASTPNTGSFAWTATGPETTTAKVRVSANGSPTATGTSGKFSLVVPAVTVKSPNTLVSWNVGTTHALTWSHNVGAGALFTIEISRDAGATWSVITTAAAAGGATSGSYDWIVAAPRATTCRIRVTWNGDTAVRDISDVNFTIK